MVLLALASCSSGGSAGSGASDSSGPSARSGAPVSSSPSTTTAPTTTAPPTTASPTLDARSALAALAALPVAEPEPGLAPYRRKAFGDGWDYDRASGCNTRERVLIAESATPVVQGARCKVVSGRWTSVYDGVTVTDPAELQIDHLVPLADAWRSGAASWTAAERERFANDLTDPNTLVAVTGRTNESKGDGSPDEWLPPDRSAHCRYAADWVEVKARWRLSTTPAEHAALERVLSAC
jgi:hypothetical protein